MLMVVQRDAYDSERHTIAVDHDHDHDCSELHATHSSAQSDAVSQTIRAQDGDCSGDGDRTTTLLQWPHFPHTIRPDAHELTVAHSRSLLASPPAATDVHRARLQSFDTIRPVLPPRHDGSGPETQQRQILRICIITKAQDDEVVMRTRELTTWLISVLDAGVVNTGRPTGATRDTCTDEGVRSIHVYVDSRLRHSPAFDAAGLLRTHPKTSKILHYWDPHFCRTRAKDLDMILTLGGDGTVLYTSRLFAEFAPPVLSFALGSLGFLTPFTFEDISGHGCATTQGKQSQRVQAKQVHVGYRNILTDMIRNGLGYLDERLRLTCTIVATNGASLETFTVLNEIVFERGSSPCITAIDLYLDGHLMTVVQADGLIISTPTGSTAYSMSAGGPLVHPSARALLLTPICPHTLSFRPMIVPGTSICTVRVSQDARGPVYISFDGHERRRLDKGDAVRISAARHSFPMVAPDQNVWTTAVCDKLMWNLRPRQKSVRQTLVGNGNVVDHPEYSELSVTDSRCSFV